MPLPTGIIMIWAYAIVDIPAGWVLCDGNNGTPDLRGRFIIGAGGALNPDDTGGANTHTHTFTSNTHWHTTSPGVDLAAGAVRSALTTADAATGTTDPTSNLPYYHALAYIMKT